MFGLKFPTHGWPRARANGRTLFQLFITVFFSLLPLLLAFITIYYSGEISASEVLMRIIGNGELIIYSATLIAPVLYATYKDPPVEWKNFFNFAAVLIIIATTTFYPLYHHGMIFKEILLPSVFITIISLILVYLIMYFDHIAVIGKSAPQKTHDSNEAFKEEFRKFRGGQ